MGNQTISWKVQFLIEHYFANCIKLNQHFCSKLPSPSKSGPWLIQNLQIHRIFLAQYLVGGLVACFLHCACLFFVVTPLWFLRGIVISFPAHCPFWPCPAPFGIHSTGLACAFCALSSPRAKHLGGFWCSHLGPFPSLQWTVRMHSCQGLASRGTWPGSQDQGHSFYFLHYPSSLLFWIQVCLLYS